KVHRAARVEHQTAAKVRVGLELLYVEAVRAAVSPPVQPPEVVPRHVLSVFSKLDAGAAVRAGMPAGDRAHHWPPREQRNPGQPRQNLRLEEGSGLLGGEHE